MMCSCSYMYFGLLHFTWPYGSWYFHQTVSAWIVLWLNLLCVNMFYVTCFYYRCRKYFLNAIFVKIVEIKKLRKCFVIYWVSCISFDVFAWSTLLSCWTFKTLFDIPLNNLQGLKFGREIAWAPGKGFCNNPVHKGWMSWDTVSQHAHKRIPDRYRRKMLCFWGYIYGRKRWRFSATFVLVLPC